MRFIKKNLLWIVIAVAAYMFKDKWMPLLGLGKQGNSGESDPAAGKVATIEGDENLYA